MVRLRSWSRWSATATTDSPGRMRAATVAHALLDPVQLLPTPRVRLVEVELDAAERAREQRVALAADGIARVGLRRVLVAEEARERGVRVGGRGRVAFELGVQRRVAVVARRRAR